MNFSITDVLAAAKQEPYAKGFDFVELSAQDREVLTTLQNAYPDNRVRFARETAVSNFYEVILGSSVSYVFVDRRYNNILKTRLASRPSLLTRPHAIAFSDTGSLAAFSLICLQALT